MTAEAALYGRGAQKKPAVAEAHIVRIARGIKKKPPPGDGQVRLKRASASARCIPHYARRLNSGSPYPHHARTGLINSSAASMDRLSPALMAGLIHGVTGESGFMRPVLCRGSGVNAEPLQVDPRIRMAGELERMPSAGEAPLRIHGDAQQHRKIIDQERNSIFVLAVQE